MRWNKENDCENTMCVCVCVHTRHSWQNCRWQRSSSSSMGWEREEKGKRKKGGGGGGASPRQQSAPRSRPTGTSFKRVKINFWATHLGEIRSLLQAMLCPNAFNEQLFLNLFIFWGEREWIILYLHFNTFKTLFTSVPGLQNLQGETLAKTQLKQALIFCGKPPNLATTICLSLQQICHDHHISILVHMDEAALIALNAQTHDHLIELRGKVSTDPDGNESDLKDMNV